jgi:hypothetical protein
MLLAQLVRAVNISANAARIYEERIRLGQEPPLLSGVDQRVVRLCGRESDVTAVSLQRSGVHIFPVYEAPEHVSHLVSEYSDNGRSPVFWCVRPGYYGYGKCLSSSTHREGTMVTPIPALLVVVEHLLLLLCSIKLHQTHLFFLFFVVFSLVFSLGIDPRTKC